MDKSGNFYHSKTKLGFIHIPKCGGCSVVQYLLDLDHWKPIGQDVHKNYAAESYNNFDATLFTTVRHPVTWLKSGYKFFKQTYNHNITFDEHIDKVLYQKNISSHELFDWHWHCQLLPSDHIGNHSVVACKLEEIEKLPKWLEQWFPNATDFTVPIKNTTEEEDIIISKDTMNKIKTLTTHYADRFGYEL